MGRLAAMTAGFLSQKFPQTPGSGSSSGSIAAAAIVTAKSAMQSITLCLAAQRAIWMDAKTAVDLNRSGEPVVVGKASETQDDALGVPSISRRMGPIVLTNGTPRGVLALPAIETKPKALPTSEGLVLVEVVAPVAHIGFDTMVKINHRNS